MITSIPFGIPDQFASGLIDGSIVRIGTLLKDSKSGYILAHVQETGLAHNLLDGVLSSPFSPISTLSSIGENIQLSHLTKLVDGLKTLQYASLGVSIAGIGVSTIGFMLMNKKLNKIQEQMSDYSQRIEQQFQELKEREFRAHYSLIQGLYERADHAYHLSSSKREWQSIASALSNESAFFRGELVYLLNQKEFDSMLFSSLITSYGICNAGRTECLLLAGEMQAAVKTAETVAQHYTMFDSLNSVELGQKSRQTQSKVKELVDGVRDAQDAAFTRPYLLNTLIEQGINGREYITALREEKEHPLLMLKTT